MSLKFKKGFLLIVETYENDGDNRNDVQTPCETVDEAKIIIKFLQLSKESQLLNIYDRLPKNFKILCQDILQKIKEDFAPALVEKVLPDLNEILIEEDPDNFHDYIIEYYSSFLGYSEFYIRSFSSAVVYEIPEDIEFKAIAL